jgi:hypothetical protein
LPGKRRFAFRCVLLSLVAIAAPILRAVPPDPIHWRSGLAEIDEDWRIHEGDNLAWAATGFDDSAWRGVDLEELGGAAPGWRWFRKRITVGADFPEVRLLLSGGNGTYELYVNGARVAGPQISSAFQVSRPTERVFALSSDGGDYVVALRTHVPANYSAYHLPQFLSVTLGMPVAIEYERQALRSERIYPLLPALAINLLLCAAGLAGLGLYRSQRGQREYLYLGLYLFTVGFANWLWTPQWEGVLPTSANYWIADPLIFVFTILQIEFTFSFARMRLTRAWRVYEVALLSPLVLIPLVWTGHFRFDIYTLIEALAILPAGLLLPLVLLVWYRRGNREAGWLILPSLLPTLTLFLFNLGGSFANLFGWSWFAVLLDPLPIGAAPVQIGDAGSVLFLFAIGFVMFFRFTRVSRERERAAAELHAAREIQQRLVPAHLPTVRGCVLEAAYFPAQEVGGDFYQVLDLPDGSTMLAVGDVSGKGLKAAMTGALAIGALRTLASEGLRPGLLLCRLNRQLAQSGDGGFVTCVCARIETGGALLVANAGHLSPYRNGEELSLDGGLPLGIITDVGYTETTFSLEPGDRLTFLSDGVVEARNKQGELFGFQRTSHLMGRSAEHIARAAQEFGQEDDITVLTVAVQSAAQEDGAEAEARQGIGIRG